MKDEILEISNEELEKFKKFGIYVVSSDELKAELKDKLENTI